MYGGRMQTDSRAPKQVLREGCMGAVLRGSLMRCKMSWYGWGFKREFNEMQDILIWMGFWGNSVLLRRKCMHILEYMIVLIYA